MLQSTHLCVCLVWSKFLRRAMLRFILFVYKWCIWEGKTSQIWMYLDSLWRIAEKSSQCKFHIFRSVPAMHFQLNGLNFSVCHRGKTLELKRRKGQILKKRGRRSRRRREEEGGGRTKGREMSKCNKMKKEEFGNEESIKGGKRRDGEREMRLGDEKCF